MSDRAGARRTAGPWLTAALVLTSAAVTLLGGALPALAEASTTAPTTAPTTASTPACQPGLGIGLVDVTGGADPRARTYAVAHVHPGARFSRRFQVCNGSTAPVTVALYPAAATIGGGSFTVPTGRTGNDLSSWITVDPPTATLAVGQRLIATATFAVPSDAVAGERYAALLAELPPTAGTAASAGMAVVNRTGVRVYLDVGPGGNPVSDFSIDTLQATRDSRGVAHVLATVHNTGARALDLHGVLQLTGGPGSQSAGPFPARLGTTIAPHTSEPVDITLGAAIRGGPWTAALALTSGELSRQARGVLSFPDLDSAVTVAVPAQPLRSAPHRSALIGIALALLALLLALMFWLWRRRHHDASGTPRPPRTPGMRVLPGTTG